MNLAKAIFRPWTTSIAMLLILNIFYRQPPAASPGIVKFSDTSGTASGRHGGQFGLRWPVPRLSIPI